MDKLNPESAQLLGQNPDQYPKVAASGGGLRGERAANRGERAGHMERFWPGDWLVKWNVEEGFLERDLCLGCDGRLRLLWLPQGPNGMCTWTRVFRRSLSLCALIS